MKQCEKEILKNNEQILSELCNHTQNSDMCVMRIHKGRVPEIFKKIMAKLFHI